MENTKIRKDVRVTPDVTFQTSDEAPQSKTHCRAETVYAPFVRQRHVAERLIGTLLLSELANHHNTEDISYDYLFDDNYPASFGNTELPYVYNPHIKNYCYHEASSPAFVAAAAAVVAASAAVTNATSSSRSASAAERTAAAAERSASSRTTAERSVRWI